MPAVSKDAARATPHAQPWFVLREPQDARALPALLTMRAERVKIFNAEARDWLQRPPPAASSAGRAICGEQPAHRRARSGRHGMSYPATSILARTNSIFTSENNDRMVECPATHR